MVKAADKVSAGFGRNPSGWHEFWPMTLSLPLPIFAILAVESFASCAKIVPAHHAFHHVTGSCILAMDIFAFGGDAVTVPAPATTGAVAV